MKNTKTNKIILGVIGVSVLLVACKSFKAGECTSCKKNV
tara:strand:- start:57 stop:173 length:117 start_codon:yes stop_codon:yes gene_type:complete